MYPRLLTRIFLSSCVAGVGTFYPCNASEPVRVPIEKLTSAEITRILEAAWSHANPEPTTDPEAARRAALESALTKLGPGTSLLQGPVKTTPPAPIEQLFSELLHGNIGYIRLGTTSAERPSQLDAALHDFRQVGVRALVIDLRASKGGGELPLAGELASSFLPEGIPLFGIKQLSTGRTDIIGSTKSPLLAVPIVILVNAKTAGVAEVFAAVLQSHANAFVLGQTTAGQAANFTHLRLNDERIFRFPSASAVLQKTPGLFPNGLKPDLTLSVSEESATAVLEQAVRIGKMTPHLQETSRPKLNEAALVAKQNPETEYWIQEQLAQKKHDTKPSETLKDEALKRAIDFLDAIETLRPKKTADTPLKPQIKPSAESSFPLHNTQ